MEMKIDWAGLPNTCLLMKNGEGDCGYYSGTLTNFQDRGFGPRIFLLLIGYKKYKFVGGGGGDIVPIVSSSVLTANFPSKRFDTFPPDGVNARKVY